MILDLRLVLKKVHAENEELIIDNGISDLRPEVSGDDFRFGYKEQLAVDNG